MNYYLLTVAVTSYHTSGSRSHLTDNVIISQLNITYESLIEDLLQGPVVRSF